MPNGRRITQENGVYEQMSLDHLDDLDLMSSALLSYLKSTTTSQQPEQQRNILKSNVAIARHGDILVVACNGVKDYGMAHRPALHVQDVGFRSDSGTAQAPTETDRAHMAARADQPGGNYDAFTQGKNVIVLRKGNDDTITKTVFKPAAMNFDPEPLVRPFIDNLCDDAVIPIPRPRSIHWLKPSKDFDKHGEMRIVRYFLDKGWPLHFIGVCKPCCELCATELDTRHIAYSRWAPLTTQLSDWKAPNLITDTTVAEY